LAIAFAREHEEMTALNFINQAYNLETDPVKKNLLKSRQRR